MDSVQFLIHISYTLLAPDKRRRRVIAAMGWETNVRLKGKIALITGASSGIGFASARCFLEEGAQVVITGQDPARLAAAVEALGGNVHAICGDIGRLSDIEAMAAELRNRYDRLDVLFLNAGMAPRHSLAEITEADFDRLFAVNVNGVLFPVQKLEPMLSDGASIIVTKSINNMIGMERTHLYAATKAAARAMVRTLASELAARNIRVNAISPGPTATGMIDKLDMAPEEVNRMIEQIMPHIPLRRGASADEQAQVALFLASSASSYITGGEIRVDGGWIDVMS